MKTTRFHVVMADDFPEVLRMVDGPARCTLRELHQLLHALDLVVGQTDCAAGPSERTLLAQTARSPDGSP